MLTRDQETIIAQCTPTGEGAIALLRLSGDNAIAVTDRIARLSSGKKLNQLQTHTIHFGEVVDDAGNSVDQLLFLLMKAPKTFTGQDTVEITCHNNQFIIEKIIAQAIAHGARLADKGEFTKRAFLHGKIDLVQAEAIKELIHANTQQALKKSLAQLQGSLSHWIKEIQTNLLKARAFCEASFEFLDEEISFAPQIKKNLQSIFSTIAQLKKNFDQQNQIREGIRIALIGSVNAGKSSLFNALIGKDRAIVTNIAGTTRDVIEAGVYRDGNYWTIADTAGLRQTKDTIEQKGIERSFQEAQKADVIILVSDASEELTNEETKVYNELREKYGNKIIEVMSKVDLIQNNNLNIQGRSQQKETSIKAPSQKNILTSSRVTRHSLGEGAVVSRDPLKTSATNPESIAILEQTIKEKVAEILKNADSPFLLNKRQFNLLLGLEKQLEKILQMLKPKLVAYELLSYELRIALEQISELTGKSIDEEGLDMIFKQFCVGK